jgi:membrane-bound lytic murein transglycosylase D
MRLLYLLLASTPNRVCHFPALLTLLCALCWLALAIALPTPSQATEHFPFYPCLKANVKFWEDVYSRYNTRQGVVHDINDLSRVYAVIDLADYDAVDGAKINAERIKAEKLRIYDLLTELGSGRVARTNEERRIAALFVHQPPSSYLAARDNIRVQLGQSDRFYEGVRRSGRYLAQAKKIFVAQGLPAELAYLPHVESSFEPRAYSKAGASGLWQFTRSTGKDYLIINPSIDERYDPYLATHAAAQLLKGNYAQLQTWPLALTAYNYGRAGMMRAVRDFGSYENIFNSYNQGAFKFASRNFYSEFLAAVRVAQRLESTPNIALERPEATSTFRLKEDMPVSRLRTAFRVSTDTFARLNPALTPAVLNGERPVPRGYLARLPASK